MPVQTLNDLCKIAHERAVSSGFYERERNLPELVMLTVGELAEAVEAERNGAEITEQNQYRMRQFARPETWVTSAANMEYEQKVRGGIEEEIADTFIRLFDLCGYYGIDIEAAIQAKMLYNATRPKKHGKKY